MSAKDLCMRLLAAVLILAAGPACAGLDIQHWRTSQGARVYFVENHDLPMLDLEVDFPAGSARDSRELSGLASLTRHVMVLGAGSYSERDIAERLADVGAVFSGQFDADRAGFKLRSLSSAHELEQAMAVLRAVLTTPHFEAAVVEREKARAIAALREAATKPEIIGEKAFSAAIYGEHPYALPEAGEPESVARLTPESMAAFHQTYYRARNMSLAIMGDISRAQAEALAEHLAADLPPGEAAPPIPPVTTALPGTQQVIAHPASQSHLFLGQPGMTRHDPDYFPLLVGNYILGGGGFDSRLMEEVRQKKGLAYSVYSYFQPMQAAGPFQIGLQTRRETTREALRTVQEVLARYLREGPDEAELAQAKNNLVGGFPLRLDSNKKILDYLAVIGFYQLPLNWLETYIPQVEAVTRAGILDAFQRRIRPEALSTVVVGGQLGEGRH
ncbi:MAG TPA: pitrilysin family protein [Thiobacillaceae bacterium]|nr:pitrilysin family protein [Thiobacillaceae bacterium]HNU64783.1 pitrilysin family protein [Thiobacillaceae bacterium]